MGPEDSFRSITIEISNTWKNLKQVIQLRKLFHANGTCIKFRKTSSCKDIQSSWTWINFQANTLENFNPYLEKQATRHLGKG